MERIFLTGLGCVTPLGNDVPSFWNHLKAGKTGIGPLTKIPTDGLRNELGGEVRNFDWEQYGEIGDCDEASGFAFAAAVEAVRQAGLGESNLKQVGLVFATNFGGAASWETVCELARDGVEDPETFAQFLPSHAVEYAAGRWGAGGPVATISNACSSGAHAIGAAVDWLRLGWCEIAVAGGFDGLGISTMAGLSILRTITPDTIRPFDKTRNGTIFGEGAAMVVVETEGSMRRRGARPIAEVAGWAVNNNAYHLTAPDKGGAGLRTVMERALRDAKVDPSEVGYINAHGTGTSYNDLAETQAIKAVFGEYAAGIPVSSIKAATSHTMGAAGSLEAIACALALRDGILPPTLNLETPDPECDLDYIPGQARKAAVTTVLTNSSGIGGNNASLVLRKVD